MLKIVIGGIIAAIVIPLAALLLRFNRKRRHIIRCAKAASDQQLEAIYAQIDQLGTEAPTCAVLARTNRRSANDGDWSISVPPYVEPGAGRGICVEVGPKVGFRLNVAFRFSTATAAQPVARGQVYRVVPVPRHLTKSGKGRNQFTPAKYVATNPQLSNALAAVCAAYPADLLSYLLAAGAETFEFDPMFQARIGGSPSWIQDAEFPECDQCRKRMALVLQLPGAMLPGKALPEGNFYFFACANHPDQSTTVVQFG